MDDRAHAVKGTGRRPSNEASRPSSPTRPPVGVMVALVVIQLAWLAWFLVVPMPNFPKESGTLRRGILLLKAFPHVVPGTPWAESLLGQAAGELSHFENLPQRLPIAAAAGLIALGAIGLGELALAGLRIRGPFSWAERLAIDYGVGTAGLGILTLLAGRLGLLSPWPFRAGLAAIAGAGLAVSWMRRERDAKPVGVWPMGLWPGVVIAVPFVVVMVLGAVLPAIDFDVLEYHLQGPKEYFLAGRISDLPHNVYTNMPFGVEMLHVMAMEVMGDWWWGAFAGQLLVALFAPMAAILIAGVAGRVGGSRSSWLSAVVYLSTPWIYRLAVIAYVEGPLCYYHAALIAAASLAWEGRVLPRGSWWGLIGLLAGGAMACKYPALISAVIPFGLLALADARREWSARPILAYAVGWAIIMAPWLGKNVLDHGNPVYPLGYRVFGGHPWDDSREAQWTRAHGPRPIEARALAESVLDVAGRSDWQSPLYVAFVPLALVVRRSRRFVLAILGYSAYLFLTWWLLTHRLDRFWLPLLPGLAILAGVGAYWSNSRAWRMLRGFLLTIAVVCNFVDCSTALTGLNEWTGDLTTLRHDLPRRLNPPLAAIDRELPPAAKILLVGQAAVFHVGHPVVYNTVFNPEIIEGLAAGKTDEEFRRVVKERGITHIYVDWKEVRRHRAPGGYGFTEFVTPERFAGWTRAGVLGRPVPVGSEQDLFEVP